MYKCHSNVALDAPTITNQLLGRWIWFYNFGYGKGSSLSHRGLEIEFASDSIYMYEDSSLIQTSGWQLQNTNDSYGLTTNPPQTLLQGRILFCDDIVEFHHSDLDGYDNYFKRQE